MNFLITIQPNNNKFLCDAKETILTAAIRAGINLPYGCKNGACSVCKGKLISGSIIHSSHQQYALSKEEQDLGFSLFCCAIPNSDLIIETCNINNDTTNFTVKKY